MKTIQQLRDEFERFDIPPLLSIDETVMLFERLDQLEDENFRLIAKLKGARGEALTVGELFRIG